MIRRVLTAMLLGCGLLSAALTEADFAQAAPQENPDPMTWWREAHLGMFIHYGLYSGLGGLFGDKPCGAEWAQNNLQMDSEQYAQGAAPLFQPAEGCAEQWARLAAAAGCRYAVLTTKHHDGFALFATETTEFNAQKLTGRDVVREFADACRANGLRVGFYHSVIDWHQPDYDYSIPCDLPYPKGQKQWLEAAGIPRNQEKYRRYLHRQVDELLTHYGRVDILWWDYSAGEMQGPAWDAEGLVQLCREKQPELVMNNRLFTYHALQAGGDAAAAQGDYGDFLTPEQRIPSEDLQDADWESCMTVGRNWGYNRFDVNLKTPAEVIAALEECVGKGGNLLLNINPRGDGSVPEGVADVFRRLGNWMQVNGAAIYGAHPVEEVDMPAGMYLVAVWDELFVYLPREVPEGDALELWLPAAEIDTVMPEILGQPDCEVTVERVEEEPETAEGEPRAWLLYTIPTQAWHDAVEGLPVLRLSAE